VETITPELLQWLWQEFDYPIDVCRVTKGAHTEALRWMHVKFEELSF
jgi:uncharacterized membrane protein YebE (DUF533 family)